MNSPDNRYNYLSKAGSRPDDIVNVIVSTLETAAARGKIRTLRLLVNTSTASSFYLSFLSVIDGFFSSRDVAKSEISFCLSGITKRSSIIFSVSTISFTAFNVTG
jgi:hypothetical protein